MAWEEETIRVRAALGSIPRASLADLLGRRPDARAFGSEAADSFLSTQRRPCNVAALLVAPPHLAFRRRAARRLVARIRIAQRRLVRVVVEGAARLRRQAVESEPAARLFVSAAIDDGDRAAEQLDIGARVQLRRLQELVFGQRRPAVERRRGRETAAQVRRRHK
eukprot:5113738-Prymnesium_polylepis.2